MLIYADAAIKANALQAGGLWMLMNVDGCMFGTRNVTQPLVLSFSRVAIRFLNLLCCSTRSIQAKHQVGSALICEAPQTMEERNGGWWHMAACSRLMNFNNILHLQSGQKHAKTLGKHPRAKSHHVFQIVALTSQMLLSLLSWHTS